MSWRIRSMTEVLRRPLLEKRLYTNNSGQFVWQLPIVLLVFLMTSNSSSRCVCACVFRTIVETNIRSSSVLHHMNRISQEVRMAIYMAVEKEHNVVNE